ncbi:hypothetical protein [uncultured Thiodictyon sp.]|uniref:hypothetical protein n=1 Tax=uncultured Thiodictyon sp. TaxID=1846217 RepID=UPI0025DC9B41|nr:hypothetical protein [uncultured Thiodictyon sp.]
MGSISTDWMTQQGCRSSYSPLAAALECRVRQVGDLIRERRKVACQFKRIPDERHRLALQRCDEELAKYRIDIPAVQRLSAIAKTGLGRQLSQAT